MNSLARRFRAWTLLATFGALVVTPTFTFAADGLAPASAPTPLARDEILTTLRRASAFMIEKVGGNRGAYVWSYLPDLSRRWGEMEATPTMLWIQPSGAPAMGDLFLDAYHVTRDEFYYRAAAQVADALVQTQHPAGGWNYIGDLAGSEALRRWYETIGRHGWRLEEFQHFYGNATFDDETTIAAARFMLRIAEEKSEPRFRASVDRVLGFVLRAQFPMGGWPQRFPPTDTFSKNGNPDYSGFVTLNDDVARANVDFLIEVHGLTHRADLLAAARRGMDALLALQQPAPQPGWALQYTPDLKPAGARTYEPRALATHATANCIAHLLDYFELTGDRKYLARIAEALDWLDRVKLPPNTPGARAHPTFVEVGTDQPLFIHRTGSNVASGRYFADGNSENTIAHYSSFRSVDTAGLRARLAHAQATSAEELAKKSPLRADAPRATPPRLVARAGGTFPGRGGDGTGAVSAERVRQIVAALNADGYWPTPLRSTSNPYRGPAPQEPAAGNFSRTQVGDAFDTSPFTAPERVLGITTGSFIGNAATLLRYLDQAP